MMRLLRSALLFVVVLPGCSTFHLYEQTGVLPIQKHRRVTDSTLAVRDFSYESQDPNDTDIVAADLDKWRSLVVSGINQANIFAEVIPYSGDDAGALATYTLDGHITSFRFQKNWVPIFFPLHLGLSFFTFTGYTLFGGPTTATIVRFSVSFELRRADTDELITSFDKSYRSTRAVNVYSKGFENPYDNPNLVFAKILEYAVIEIAAALPDDSQPPPDETPLSPQEGESPSTDAAVIDRAPQPGD
jgi:hypothetical protein